MRLPLTGARSACAAAVAALRATAGLDVLEVSSDHPDRGGSRLVRVSVDARLTDESSPPMIDDTTDVMADAQIEEIELRALAATREPWHIDTHPRRTNLAGAPQAVVTDAGDLVATTFDAARRWPARDAAFIAHARTDIPALIAEVRRLRRHDGSGRRGGGVRGWAVTLTVSSAALLLLLIDVLTVVGWWGLAGILLCLASAACLGWLAGGAGGHR